MRTRTVERYEGAFRALPWCMMARKNKWNYAWLVNQSVVPDNLVREAWDLTLPPGLGHPGMSWDSGT